MSLIQKARPGGREGLGPSPGRERRRRGRGPLLLLLLFLLLVAVAALWWLRETGTEPAVEPLASEGPFAEEPPLGAAEPLAPEPEVAPAPEPEPAPEAAAPPPAEGLPPREKSDDLVRELARSVSSHRLFLATLAEAGVIDRFVLIVDNLAEGTVPRRELAFLKPEGRFLVLGAEPDQRIDPASYGRYAPLADAIASLDARQAAAAYRRVASLCEESYRALGYPEGGFERRLRAALALLVSTPILDQDPAVVPETKRYEFADPELESLTDAQKQLLRMGPANARRVTAKLREIQAALGTPSGAG